MTVGILVDNVVGNCGENAGSCGENCWGELGE